LLEGETLAVFEKLQFLPSFELGMPLIWRMWQSLPVQVRNKNKVPRSIEELVIITSLLA
jgi:hypothetical protein